VSCDKIAKLKDKTTKLRQKITKKEGILFSIIPSITIRAGFYVTLVLKIISKKFFNF